jgi:TPR repeat protein
MSHSRIRSLALAAQFVLVIFMIGFAPNVFVVTAAADADISQIQASAKHGNIREQIALADAYFSGHGVKQDLKMAAFWY